MLGLDGKWLVPGAEAPLIFAGWISGLKPGPISEARARAKGRAYYIPTHVAMKLRLGCGTRRQGGAVSVSTGPCWISLVYALAIWR
jgi:hypothetical protein